MLEAPKRGVVARVPARVHRLNPGEVVHARHDRKLRPWHGQVVDAGKRLSSVMMRMRWSSGSDLETAGATGLAHGFFNTLDASTTRVESSHAAHFWHTDLKDNLVC